jgi:hypothetical protein
MNKVPNHRSRAIVFSVYIIPNPHAIHPNILLIPSRSAPIPLVGQTYTHLTASLYTIRNYPRLRNTSLFLCSTRGTEACGEHHR